MTLQKVSPTDSRNVPPKDTRSGRLLSLDVYRGFVMFLMLAESLEFCELAELRPLERLWSFLCTHQSHVEWTGCTLHDLIQPSFSFLVGVALPFSLASRRGKGSSWGGMLAHALWRSFLLITFGIALRSLSGRHTNFTFEDTLTQIGLGYTFLFLIGSCSPRWQGISLLSIVTCYWLLFALFPLPLADFQYPDVGVPADWPHLARGFAAHWNKNSNLAWYFDTWFLNLFPRAEPFAYNGGGYSTLSFIPTLGTMVLGLLAGNVLRLGEGKWRTVRWFAVLGLIGIVAGLALERFGICPIVKRIWTPSWVLFSGGWCLWILAAFHIVVDRDRVPKWTYPLVVLGSNSIAIYLMSWTVEGFVRQQLLTHLGSAPFQILGDDFQGLLLGATTLFVLWSILWWMYRQRIFLRV